MTDSMNKFPHLVFVYGTLKRSEPNHVNYMKHPSRGTNSWIGVGQLVGRLPLVVASRHNVPYLLDRPGLGHHVEGEVYECDDSMLDLLDEIEDAPRYYKRKCENVRIISEPTESGKISVGDIVECWCYKMDQFKEELLDKTFLKSYSSKEYPYTESLDIQHRSMDYYQDIKK